MPPAPIGTGTSTGTTTTKFTSNVISIVPANGLAPAPTGAGTSADTMMTKFVSYVVSTALADGLEPLGAKTSAHAMMTKTEAYEVSTVAADDLVQGRLQEQPQWNIWKGQLKHSYLTLWFAGNGLAPSTNKYYDFDATLTCSGMDKKCSLHCPKLKIHNRMYRNGPFIFKISYSFHSVHHYIVNLWEFCLCSIIPYWHHTNSQLVTR